jgi:hypothetical protein
LNDYPADLEQDAVNLALWAEQELLAGAAEGFVLVVHVVPKWLIGTDHSDGFLGSMTIYRLP